MNFDITQAAPTAESLSAEARRLEAEIGRSERRSRWAYVAVGVMAVCAAAVTWFYTNDWVVVTLAVVAVAAAVTVAVAAVAAVAGAGRRRQ